LGRGEVYVVDYNDYFEYRGGKLYNKTNRSANARMGEEAGYADVRYHRTSLSGKLLLTHRVIWEMHYGLIPDGLQIDHIDHDKMNNNIENLRIVSAKENNKNLPKVTNISWIEKRGVWQASIKLDGKNIWLGYHKNKEIAELVVSEARDKYGFHQNHGASL
jgi:hypothetical protein